MLIVVLPLQTVAATHTPTVSAGGNAHLDAGISEFADAPRALNAPDPRDAKHVPYMPGWPAIMDTNIFDPYGVVLSDLDGDGTQEVVAGSTDGKLYAWQYDGSLRTGWPVNLGSYVQAKPAVADFDHDGYREVVAALRNGVVTVLRHNGSVLPGWPKTTGQGYGAISPNVYDLDGDGTPEVLWSARTKLHAWRISGAVVSGFPVTLTEHITGTLAIGDVVADAAPELFAVTLEGTLYGFRANGTQLSGWPVHFGWETSWAAPSIGPLMNNGRRQILVVGSNGIAGTNIYGYESDGTSLPNFPINYPSLQTYSCPVLANIDGDKELEIFNGGKVEGPSFWAWNHDGSLVPGFPQDAAPYLEGSTIVANFDTDPAPEVVIADNFNPGKIFAYNANGTSANYFPILKPHSCGPASPSVGDVDGDGFMDIALTMSTGVVGLWRLTVPWQPANAQWPTLFHDNWNTNDYGFREPSITIPTKPAPLLPNGEAEGGSPSKLHVLFVSASQPEAVLQFESASAERISCDVLDVHGRAVRRIPERLYGPGTQELVWDGKDGSGSRVATGIYFLSVSSERWNQSVRVILVR